MGSPHDTQKICCGCQRWVSKTIPTVYCPQCQELCDILRAFQGRVGGRLSHTISHSDNLCLHPDMIEAIRAIRTVFWGDE